MVLRRILGGRSGERKREYTIDELIILERYEEAEERLKARIKVRNDLHDHLKLAEVYLSLKQGTKAVDEYVYVAEEYAADGFHGKGIAILSKAVRLNPIDETLTARLQRMEKSKQLDQSRSAALEGLRQGHGEGRNTAISVVEFQALWKSLRDAKILDRFRSEQLRLLFASAEIVHLQRGQVVVEAGVSREELYLLASGEIEVWESRSAGSPLRIFASGSILGEGALFDRRPWPATYISKGLSTVLKLDRAALERCLVGNPDPRGFLETLRRQGNDQELINSLRKLRAQT